ncbi:Aste57867_20130 [Aphanomyces stellatus]|uniref:Elicitin n=1 Tax=Aphanomyces stellatus TaxID=120398 RepID=A0A485LFS9_9STRA|nr:hypothetical protein As57867_020064 [Aphanomyces stellatus]VFT96825.1 Aste57867_20130 [Aphanomyces stellatus]
MLSPVVLLLASTAVAQLSTPMSLLESSDLLGGGGPKPCEYTTLAPLFLPIMPNIQQCTTASNYTFVPPTTLPTPAQTQVLCSAPPCTAALSAMTSLALPNCTVVIRTQSTPVASVLQTLVGQCAQLNATTATPSPSSTSDLSTLQPTADGTPATSVPAKKSTASPRRNAIVVFAMSWAVGMLMA